MVSELSRQEKRPLGRKENRGFSQEVPGGRELEKGLGITFWLGKRLRGCGWYRGGEGVFFLTTVKRKKKEICGRGFEWGA